MVSLSGFSYRRAGRSVAQWHIVVAESLQSRLGTAHIGRGDRDAPDGAGGPSGAWRWHRIPIVGGTYVERRQLDRDTRRAGATPGLEQAIHEAALATEAEGFYDVAGLLRGWAERLVTRRAPGEHWRPEVWFG